VAADGERLEEVLDNLISNAMKFSAPIADVSVTVEPVEGGTTVSVHDSGAGIPAAELSRIFDRFYRVPGPATHGIGGSGLGLYIARAYVLAMGGRLWVESEPGNGSSFFVLLPSPAQATDLPAEDKDARTTAPALGG
jgi:signal transduction histidine kinase